jgi:hypothetical protein
MGFGQTMLTAAFLVLITIAAMNANKMIVDRDRNYYEQEAYRQGAILANALLTEILTKKFDELIDPSDYGYANTTDFTTNSSLGVDGFEWFLLSASTDAITDPTNPRYKSISSSGFTAYDDVDDYDGYTRSAQSGTLTGFVLTVDVYYVNSTDLNTKVTTRTYYKKIDVIVKNSTYFQQRDLDGDGNEDDDIELKFSVVKAY